MSGSPVRDKRWVGGVIDDKRLYGSYSVQITSFDCHLNQILFFLYSQDQGVTR